MKTIADIKRAMQVGTKWHTQMWDGEGNLIKDFDYRTISSSSTVGVKFETLNDEGMIVHSRFDFPSSTEVEFPDEDIFIVDKWNGRRKLSYHRLEVAE